MRIAHTQTIVAAFFCCYLEWGNRSAFLFQMVPDIFSRHRAGENIIHPAILIPLGGLLLLVASAVMPTPKRWMMWAGLLMPALLVFFILLIGILGGNWRFALSTLPFIILAILYVKTQERISGNASAATAPRSGH